jgi:hypothetical protein
MSNANSHTHCQAAPANAKTNAWQRVCLPHRTTKTTDKPSTEKEQRRHKIVFITLGFKWLNQAFCPTSAFVSADRDVARNPQRFIHVTVLHHLKQKQYESLQPL